MTRAALTSRSLHLPAREPFDFARSLSFVCGFAPGAGEQRVEDGRLCKPLRVDGVTLLAEIQAAREAGLTGVRCTLWSEGRLDEARATRAFARVRTFLSLDDELAPFYALARRDAAFAPVVERLHGYHQLRFASAFEVACWAVLSQRCPVPVARKLKQALVARWSSSIDFEGASYAPFPEPADLAGASTPALTDVLGHAVKAQRIAAVTAAFAGVDEAFLYQGDHDEVRAWLLAIDGIGPWSASFVLLRGLGRMERVPAGEGALADAVAAVYGTEATPARMRELAAPYGAYQGYWAHYLRAAS